MDQKEKIEMTRKLLSNAISMNVDKEIILRISRIIDKSIIEYLRSAAKRNI
ncbi:Spo0E family sporulation regulatory protein-aspartic acid phosphatase [Caldanaerobius polysaccharolyticus]|uniref:Spo0E family sporulation regulatory protein-aspartic acid phosphatase n=1 Tax=Caldanaerobius polysaccharolyticus TaxID=44256 RepID=UPI0012EB5141|nr:Spo0E family sporulation regulatory protein-aspartic acid phosphatase [Caldanaerobius polysaccharolyticus]